MLFPTFHLFWIILPTLKSLKCDLFFFSMSTNKSNQEISNNPFLFDKWQSINQSKNLNFIFEIQAFILKGSIGCLVFDCCPLQREQRRAWDHAKQVCLDVHLNLQNLSHFLPLQLFNQEEFPTTIIHMELEMRFQWL